MTELGQLDPDWFQVLTTRASSKEGNLSDSDDQEELCPNQEANFKTPLRKTAAADVAQSQHSSIPRVFRRSYVPSPDNDDRQGVENCISDLKPVKTVKTVACIFTLVAVIQAIKLHCVVLIIT